MNKKYTSGPWLIKGDEVGCISNHDDQSFGMFCPVAIVTNQDSAGLIAAAPELLDSHEPEREGPEFLDWVADRLVHKYGDKEGADFIICLRRRAEKSRAAIAKALGGKNE